MKSRIISIFVLVATLLGMSACQQPEEFNPNVERNAIENLTASFIDDDRDENLFTSEIDHANRVITVVFPYYYPRSSDNVLNPSHLRRMRVEADLDYNAYITPPILFMDMSKDNTIQVTDQVGNDMTYTVKAEIRKSDECAITKFDIPAFNLSGVINEDAKTISLLTFEDITDVLAEVTLSRNATISPDPTTTPLSYNEPVQLTVTAHDGVTKAVYTVKKDIPNKVAAGMRSGSAKLLWAKKLSDIGLTSSNMQTSIAHSGNYLIVNERANGNAVYVNALTGEVEGAIDISSVAGSLTNFCITSDDAGNILLCNLANAAGATFTIYRITGVTGSLEKYIEITTPAPIGRKISVIGNLDGDAIITAPHYTGGGSFSRWEVKNGALVSAEPTTVTLAGIASWGTHADVIYSDPTSVQSNYYVAYYGAPRHHTIADGVANTILAAGAEISSNWTMNAVDYHKFNKVGYMITHSVNSFTWGADDCLYLYDVSANNLDTQALNFGADGLNINSNYGAKALGNVNGNGTGDVLLVESADGFYLYIYFMFTNGYVGCVQCDCIEM